MRVLGAVALLTSLCATASTTPPVDARPSQHDVLPVLELRCTACHGLRRQVGGLDLRTVDAILKGGKSGPAVVPGDADKSPLVRRMADGLCPPKTQLLDFGVKLPTGGEIEKIRRWVAAGAQQAEAPADAPDPVKPEDRAFWSFRPPRDVEPPAVARGELVRNPVDAFVLRKLEDRGLSFAPEADRHTLIRRAYFDLTGLPPAPDELEAHLADATPDWYETMVDRLLASPRHGERWARFWLDLAGYADSEGKTSQDLERPFAWRYRDYVIRSLNADKPYDRFLLEQIAGDELADYERAPVVTQELEDNLVATGFLRMGPDGTWTRDSNLVPERIEVITDSLDVLSEGVLGLTMKCARCHDHKYDPVSQRDYFRLRDVFKGALDEHDWMRPSLAAGINFASHQFAPRYLNQVTTAERRAWEADQNAAEPIEAALNALERPLQERHLERELAKLPAALHDDLRRTLQTPKDQRTEVQKYLAEKFEKSLRADRAALKAADAEFARFADEAERRLAHLRRPEPLIQAVWDRGQPSPTYVLRRGDFDQFAQRVGPGVPSVFATADGRDPLEIRPPWPGAQKTGRRLAFARWVTRPDHPLTARVMVNRLWLHHFGRPIVASVNNFGRSGARPTHPELLDWLAREFVRRGWSLKQMHRLLVTSRTYRQSGDAGNDAARLDPDNALWSRMPLRRLDAEQLRDALLFVAGRLDETRFGPGESVTVRPDGSAAAAGTGNGSRRSVYVRQRRTELPTILTTFDFPQLNPNCLTRPTSTVAPQALLLMNDPWVHRMAEALARRVEAEPGADDDDPAARVDRVYRLTLSRPPTDVERDLGRAALAELTAAWRSAPGEPGQGAAAAAAARAKVMKSYCHAVLNSAAFLYVE